MADESGGLVGRLNAATQSMIALGLTGGLVYGFIIGKVSDDSFTNIAFAAISFIYGARTASAALRDKAASDVVAGTTAANVAATTAATTAATIAAVTGTGPGTAPPVTRTPGEPIPRGGNK